jgi:large subunit ribosomal protein L18
MAKTRQYNRSRRKLHIRKKVSGTEAKPRVFVFRSNQYVYIAAANDDIGVVLTSMKSGKTVEDCKKLGAEFGKKLSDLKIVNACFDRAGYKYHTRLDALVEGIRQSGIKI